jgi:PEP-CTERM motif
MNTKNLIKLTSALALAACFSAPAQAGFITGTINMGGELSVTGPGINGSQGQFLNSTGVIFNNASSLSHTGTGSGDFNVPSSTVTYKNFSFDPVLSPNPVSPLWTFVSGGRTYSFDMSSVTFTRFSGGGANFLGLDGTGTVHITGLDDTPGTWSATVQRNINGPAIVTDLSFSATQDSGANNVPEPLTLSLLGIGMASLAAKRKLHVGQTA